MQSKRGQNLFEYAVIRYIPRVERGEFVNVGLVMMCKRKRWIRVAVHLDERRLRAIFPEVDPELLRGQLEGFRRVARGEGIAGLMEVHERFRWLTAVRSACIATDRPHPGFCDDPDATFDRLMADLVL